MKKLTSLITEKQFRLTDNTDVKTFAPLCTCPYCDSTEFDELGDYDCVAANEKNVQYQYYALKCKKCGKKYYNVYRSIGALSNTQFNNIVDKRFANFEDHDD